MNTLPCGHTVLEHKIMEEAKASSELEGAKSDLTICQLIDTSK